MEEEQDFSLRGFRASAQLCPAALLREDHPGAFPAGILCRLIDAAAVHHNHLVPIRAALRMQIGDQRRFVPRRDD